VNRRIAEVSATKGGEIRQTNDKRGQMGALHTLLRSGIVCSAAMLSACGLADQFAERAVVYNLQAEQAQAENLLLNVVRASLRRPMQFTSVSSVAASSGEKGDLTLSIPFGPHHGPKSAQLMSEVSSGISSLTTNIQDTREFYWGIVQPVAPTFINLLFRQGYPRSQILYLLTNSIDVDLDNGTRLTARNYVGDDFEFEVFAAVLDFLLQSGMTTEEVSNETPI
jgi:hypothetical protein